MDKIIIEDPPQAKLNKLSQEINFLVEKTYGLSTDEINLINYGLSDKQTFS